MIREGHIDPFAFKCYDCFTWVTGVEDDEERNCPFCNKKWYRVDDDCWSPNPDLARGDINA